MKNILITGGLGFIGSHICIELLDNNYNVVIIDNLSNTYKKVIDKIKFITNKSPKFYNFDLSDKNNNYKLKKIFVENDIMYVIHLAGYKSVSESVENPLMYYDNNINSTINLLYIMKICNCFKLIFSSSATIYGKPLKLPIDENESMKPFSPYGRTKMYIECMLEDICNSDERWKICSLRYFNPVSCHPSGIIGENPKDIPQNLFPFVIQLIQKKKNCLNIYGKDYDTIDGTGVRDYIHILDLANAHHVTLSHLHDGYTYYNVGTGTGYSVLEIINKCEKLETLNMNNNKLPDIFFDNNKSFRESV